MAHTSSSSSAAPVPSDKMPPGIPYIIGNEAAERFSYYGMRTILVVFMTQYLMGSSGQLELMSEPQAKSWYHWFLFAVYAFPVLGALVSDGLLGKYRTILWLSIVYCCGHAALAIDDTRTGLAIGLGLIALGSGGIKPCVSANVGDQFTERNKHLLEKVFSWFYFSVNFGAFFSTVLTPVLLVKYGPSVAFAVPGILMFLATIIFWIGRNKFVHVPPGGPAFLREVFSREGIGTLAKVIVIYLFIMMFWALYDQTGSSWLLQAQAMDRHLLGYEIQASQVQAINPILILVLIPLFAYVLYPAMNRVFSLTPLRKMGIGFFLTAGSFFLAAMIESWIQAGFRPHVAWQFLAYVAITAAEVMVSVTGLEFSYTQAPPKMKSVVMSLYLLAVSLGNAFTAVVNQVIQDEHGKPTLTGANYYLFFAAVMAGTAVVFIVVATFYHERTYIQDEAAVESS
ncbi:MAG TPA: POT family MFS transporter [Pirellulales bacterium]|nr:POT family MFS transporter [Pirellulales bacterium]